MPLTGGVPALYLLVRAVLRGDVRAREAIWRDRRQLDDVARAAQRGDENARNALCVILRPHLERIAAGMGAGARDIPDLVQETLIAAHLNLDRFDPARGSMQTWAATILARLRLNALRRRARRLRCLEALTRVAGRAPGRRGARVLDAPPGGRDFVDLLGRLSRRQRQVVTIYVIGGLSARETGRCLGLSEAGVRSIARDARIRLRRVWEC